MSGASIASWARTAEFTTPVRLGDIETEVLSRPVDDVPAARSDGSRIAASVVGALLVLAPPLVGLIALWSASQASGADADLGLDISRAAYLVAAVMPVALLVMWWLVFGRRRSALELPAAGASALFAVAGLVLVAATATDVSRVLFVRMILAALAGAVCFVIMLVASRRDPAPAAPDAVTDEQRAHLRDRTLVAHVLRDRGLIDAATYEKALTAPLGGWREFDRHTAP
jgi:hypothetical protein